MTLNEKFDSPDPFLIDPNEAVRHGYLVGRLDSIDQKLDDLQYLLEQLTEKLMELDLPYNTGFTLDE